MGIERIEEILFSVFFNLQNRNPVSTSVGRVRFCPETPDNLENFGFSGLSKFSGSNRQK